MSDKKHSSPDAKENAREVDAELLLEEESVQDQDLSEDEIRELSPEILLDEEDKDDDSSEEAALVPYLDTGKDISLSDPLTQYMAEVQRYPLLTQEQEYELAVKYRETGDKTAAEQLVTANLRFVIKVAAEYAKYGNKLIDVIQEGNVGLMHAVKEFNPYKGVRLITYAVWWIRGYIKEYLMKQQSLVRIGTNAKQKKLFHQLRREERQLQLEGKEPDVKRLAEKLDVSEKDVIQMQQRLRHGDLSLDQKLDSESATQWIDLQVNEEEELQDQTLERQDLLNLILKNIMSLKESLNEKELYILKHRIMADEPMTLQEIGDHFAISRERTRQLEARILKRIRENIAEQMNPDTDT